jgi:hypothetical protein
VCAGGRRRARRRDIRSGVDAAVRYNDAMTKALTPKRIWLARGIALAADALQLGLFPLFVGGVPEGADLALEAVTGVLLCALCGFSPAFLPTIIAEALPMVDMFPSWTLATLFVTRNSAVVPKALPGASDATHSLR